MSVPRRSLDDRTYADLRAEALAVVTAGASGWTDLNPSDPGVTVLELFAFLAEGLVYRSDRITPADVEAFLRLVNGPAWQWRPDPAASPEVRAAALAEQVRRARVSLRHEERAVTPGDYERLAAQVPGVHGVACLPRRHVGASPEVDRPGHVTVVVVPAAGADAAEVRSAVAEHLAPRRLLGTHVHVAPPVPAPVSARLLVRSRRDVRKETVRTAVSRAVGDLLDDRPLGEPLHVSGVRAALEQVPGVDVVASVSLRSPVAQREYHDSGGLVGLTVRRHERLVAARRPGCADDERCEDVEVALARGLVTVHVRIRLELAPGRTLPVPPALAARTAVDAAGAWFPPDAGDLDLVNSGWGRDSARPVRDLEAHVATALARLPGWPDRGDDVLAHVSLTTAPERVSGDPPGTVVWFERDELPYVRCGVELVQP